MRYWYLPISVKYFDFVRCLHDYDTFDVRMYANHKFNVGDAVFVYSGKPYGQFLYQMEIVKTDIPFAVADLHNEYRPEPCKSTINNWMRLKVVKAVPSGTPSLRPAHFTALGFRFIRMPRLIKDKDMLYYLYA